MELKYVKAYTAKDGKYTQSDLCRLNLPDGRNSYSHKVYMNKLFRVSGYKSIKVVKNIYDVVGEDLDVDPVVHPIELGDGVVLTSDDDNFIYFYTEKSYTTFVNIINYINELDGFIISGDKTDLTHFTIAFKLNNIDYSLVMDLKSEYFMLYQVRNNNLIATDYIRPSIIMEGFLDQGDTDVYDAFKSIINEYVFNDYYLPYETSYMSIGDLRSLLSSSGLIKYSRRKYKLVKDLSNQELQDKLINYVEMVNTVARVELYKPTVYANDVYAFITSVYEDLYYHFDDEEYVNTLNLPSILYNLSKWKEND